MKDMGDASYVIDIKIHRDRDQGTLGFSQESYINKFLEKYRMKDCSLRVNEGHSLASTVGSLMYAQIYTRPDISFVVEILEDIRVIQFLTTVELQRKSYDIFKEQKTTCLCTNDQIT